MNIIEQSYEYKSMMVDRERQRKIGHLTLSLLVALHINPHGHELVAICGFGDERDNTEAVRQWVERETCCASCMRTISFKRLQQSFLRFLVDATDQYPEGL